MDKIVKIMSVKYPGSFIYALYINDQIENFSNSLTNIKLLAELSGINSDNLPVVIQILDNKEITK